MSAQQDRTTTAGAAPRWVHVVAQSHAAGPSDAERSQNDANRNSCEIGLDRGCRRSRARVMYHKCSPRAVVRARCLARTGSRRRTRKRAYRDRRNARAEASRRKLRAKSERGQTSAARKRLKQVLSASVDVPDDAANSPHERALAFPADGLTSDCISCWSIVIRPMPDRSRCAD